MTLPVLPDEHMLMLGLTGSRLYGLNHADSDYDWKGVYQQPLTKVLSLGGVRPNYTIKDPDTQLYELGRYFELLVKSNPTVLEMLYLPEYEITSNAWSQVVENRELFLSQKVRTVYYGFGVGQLKLFRSGKGDAKAARHFYRVMEQGEHILRHGFLAPRPKNPERIIEDGEWASRFPEAFRLDAESLLRRFDSIPTDLPLEVDMDAINDLLFTLRMNHDTFSR